MYDVRNKQAPRRDFECATVLRLPVLLIQQWCSGSSSCRWARDIGKAGRARVLLGKMEGRDDALIDRGRNRSTDLVVVTILKPGSRCRCHFVRCLQILPIRWLRRWMGNACSTLLVSWKINNRALSAFLVLYIYMHPLLGRFACSRRRISAKSLKSVPTSKKLHPYAIMKIQTLCSPGQAWAR